MRDWLVRIGMGSLISSFEDAGITGRGLCGMMRISRAGGAGALRELLRDELGVKRLGTQLELLEELCRLWD